MSANAAPSIIGIYMLYQFIQITIHCDFPIVAAEVIYVRGSELSLGVYHE